MDSVALSHTETELLWKFPAPMSTIPSPFRSARAMPIGDRPDGKVCGAWKVPGPLLSRTPTVLPPRFVTAMSGRPSTLTSPIATPAGLVPPEEYVAGEMRPPRPLPIQTDTLFPLKLPVTTSGLLSPFRSPVAMLHGLAPTGKLDGAPRLPSPLPRSTATLELFQQATTTSSLLSRFMSRSDAASGPGEPAMVKFVAAPRIPLAEPSRTVTVFEL